MKKKNIISFIPKDELVIDYAPKPEPMSKNLPAWWRKQEPFVGGEKKVMGGQYNETVKKCPGILDVLISGYVLKTPCDIYIDATDPKKVELQVPGPYQACFTAHSMEQVSEWNFDRDIYAEYVFRVHPQWVVKTSPGHSTFFMQPQFHEDLPYQAVSAIIDTDMYASDGPFSFLVKKGFKGEIPYGTPLVQCIPFKREEYEMEILEKPDLRTLNTIPQVIRKKFGGAYKTWLWEKKVFK
jgi:hypothetical protein